MNRRRGLPKHCSYETGRHGKRRIRFRWRNVSRYILGEPWGTNFMAAYGELLAVVGAHNLPAPVIGASRSAPHSLDALIKAYLASPAFLHGAAETRRTRANILDRFSREHGDKPLFYIDVRTGERTMLLKRAGMQKIINAKAATPHAQRNLLNTVRAMFKWAMKEGCIADNPTFGVEREKVAMKGYKTWSDAEVARFEAHHPIGSTARLAFALMLYTGARRSDIVRLGQANLEGDRLTFKQQKTGMMVSVPVHPRLAEILTATPTIGIKTFVVTRTGKPFSVAGFGNRVRAGCDAASCPDLSAHAQALWHALG